MSSARVVKSLPKILRKSVILGCVGYTFQQYVASPWLLAEDSMDPTFKDGQLVLSTAWYNSLSRGDVVIVKQLQNPKERVCKRIVGTYFIFYMTIKKH
jgi:signal peptidase I